jgi:hypothetical protein
MVLDLATDTLRSRCCTEVSEMVQSDLFAAYSCTFGSCSRVNCVNGIEGPLCCSGSHQAHQQMLLAGVACCA